MEATFRFRSDSAPALPGCRPLVAGIVCAQDRPACGRVVGTAGDQDHCGDISTFYFNLHYCCRWSDNTSQVCSALRKPGL